MFETRAEVGGLMSDGRRLSYHWPLLVPGSKIHRASARSRFLDDPSDKVDDQVLRTC